MLYQNVMDFKYRQTSRFSCRLYVLRVATVTLIDLYSQQLWFMLCYFYLICTINSYSNQFPSVNGYLMIAILV